MPGRICMTETPSVSRTRTVLLALGQVWLIVGGILVSGLSGKLAAQARGVPVSTQFLVQCGPLLLLIPLAWSVLTLVFRINPAIPERSKRNIYRAGWVIVVVLMVAFLYGIASPWNQPSGTEHPGADLTF